MTEYFTLQEKKDYGYEFLIDWAALVSIMSMYGETTSKATENLMLRYNMTEIEAKHCVLAVEHDLKKFMGVL